MLPKKEYIIKCCDTCTEYSKCIDGSQYSQLCADCDCDFSNWKQNKSLPVSSKIINEKLTYHNCGVVTDGKVKEFEELSDKMCKFLRDNFHPMTKIIIEIDRAEIVEGLLNSPKKLN